MPALDFLAVRFSIAAVLLLVAPRGAAAGSPPRPAARRVVLGGLYGVAQILQTAGLAHTPASVSGFITGMYVVATPLFAAVLLRSRITGITWAAVALAAGGLGVLTLDGFSVGYGEALTLVAAMLYALHIVGLGAWSTPRDALGMSILQVVVVAVICLVASAPHGIVLPDNGRDWLSVVYMAVVPGGARAARPDLGAGPPAADAHRDRDEHGAGLRGAVRGLVRRRVGDRCGWSPAG